MKNSLLALLLCLSANALFSQFGVSVKYQSNSLKDWNTEYASRSGNEINFFDSSLEFGLNYWFKLKNNRIEFLPEISYAKYSQSQALPQASNLGFLPSDLTTLAFNTNIQIYPLDFDGDCNCPTWGKDGNVIEKGFYWLLNPGLAMHKVSLTAEDVTDDISNMSLRMGIGAGLDIGIHKIMTISPFVLYSRDFGIGSDDATYSWLPTANGQWNVGMRLIFRPDYKF